MFVGFTSWQLVEAIDANVKMENRTPNSRAEIISVAFHDNSQSDENEYHISFSLLDYLCGEATGGLRNRTFIARIERISKQNAAASVCTSGEGGYLLFPFGVCCFYGS